MALYDDTESVEKVKVFDHGVDFKEPADVRRVPAVVPHRRHRRPQARRAWSRCSPRRATSSNASRTGERPLTDGDRRPPRRRLARGGRARRCVITAACADRVLGRETCLSFRRETQPLETSTSRPASCSGTGCDLQAPLLVGKAPRGAREGERAARIGAGATIRPFTTIYAGSVFGDRLQTGQGACIREDNEIGDDVSIGTNAVLEFGNRIGNRVRIHTGCFLELVTIEDDVFVGPNVVFTDDPHPMNCPRYQDCKGGAVVRRRARIGANSTILPGVEIGEEALVGAGSVVVHDVPPGMVVVGNPARVVKRVDELVCCTGLVERPYSWQPAEPE